VGNGDTTKIDLPLLRNLFLHIYRGLVGRGYFNEAFGYYCTDNNHDIQGSAGRDTASFFFLRLRKTELHPVETRCSYYTEDDLFDVIELLYDVVSATSGSVGHDWCTCGGCSQKYDKSDGQEVFREEINDVLRDYGDGWKLSKDGEISAIGDAGLESLLDAPIPSYDSPNVDEKIRAAIKKFRDRRSNSDDKREAVRRLADVLEFLRPQLKTVLMEKDENDLFNIANQFTIRHHKLGQKTKYDGNIWLPWIFYVYLSTIHVSIRLLKRAEPEPS
jgi:hypothetical protein